MTAKEYAKSKGVELVGKISRSTFMRDGNRWTCFRDEVGNMVNKKMKSEVFELITSEELRKETEEWNKKFNDRASMN